MDGNKTAARPAPANRPALALVCCTVVIFALATAADHVLDRYHLCSSETKASFILPCVRVTAAAAAQWRALWLAMLCCAVLEAAVAALALRLPCCRRALGYLQLALTIICFYLNVGATRILLAADPGYHLFEIFMNSWFANRAVDSFMDLVLPLGGEE